MSAKTLYARIGGKDAVDAAVDIFYTKVLADPRIRHHFDGVDMTRQISHQKAFMTYAFGGMETYPGKNMREAHKHLKLTEDDFNAVAEHLEETLDELSVPAPLINEIMLLVGGAYDDILNL